MHNKGARFVWAGLLAGVWVIGSAGFTFAQTETRTFAVSVDGKPAGSYRMSSSIAADGTETVTASADIKVRILIINYTYTLRSKEVWKGGKVIGVESAANNDGKRTSVTATSADNGLAVTVNGKPKVVRADVVTSTGWRMPDPKLAQVSQFDVEEGTETPCKVEVLTPGKVVIKGVGIEAQRFKLTGKDVDAEWWFDAAGKPLAQYMVWDGHKVVLSLTEIAR